MLVLILCSCKTESKKNTTTQTKIPTAGEWRMEFDLGKEKLPVNFSMNHVGDNSLAVTFSNADEKIEVTDIIHSGDSIFIQMPIFSSKFYLKTISKKKLSGYFIDLGRAEPYRVPVTCEYGSSFRFRDGNTIKDEVLEKNWQVTFSPNKPNDTWKAGGVFQHKNNGRVHGTFLTETGDFRYLEGDMYNDTLKLSCFDGAHLFLFSATLKQDSLINGRFYSGRHYEDSWVAVQNDELDLRDPFAITEVISDDDWKKTIVKNLRNEELTLGEISQDNKVRIIQILGSWCPNCMDETRYYKDLYKSFPNEIQIIPVGFEKPGEGIETLTKMRMDMRLPYDVFLGGINDKSDARKLFPMLNNVISFPTSIIVGKNGNIRKVHTGFYGPGTEEYYKEYVKEMGEFIQKLISE